MHRVTSVFVNRITTLEKLVEILSSLLGVDFARLARLDLSDGPLYRSFMGGVDIEIDVFATTAWKTIAE